MLPKNIEEIRLDHLQKLVDRRVTESATIDFKRDMYRLDSTKPDEKTKQHKELLKDVCAFANANGGDLLLGVAELDGAAGEVVGVETDNADNLKRRLIDLIRNGADPKVSFHIHSVRVSATHHVLVVRVYRSGHAPHRTVYRGEQGPFWARNSGGNHQLTAPEIADLSRESVSLKDKIENFRSDRVESVS